MKCPFCREGEFAVVDSRHHAGGFPIRRRRRCSHCKRRVSTIEQFEEVPLKVVKKDNSRELFDLAKLRIGLEKACYKRPISSDQVEGLARQVESDVYTGHFGEVASSVIGELVMKYLKDIDQVAYVRFASVYREFQDVSDFVQELEAMLVRKRNGRAKSRPCAKQAKEPNGKPVS